MPQIYETYRVPVVSLILACSVERRNTTLIAAGPDVAPAHYRRRARTALGTFGGAVLGCAHEGGRWAANGVEHAGGQRPPLDHHYRRRGSRCACVSRRLSGSPSMSTGSGSGSGSVVYAPNACAIVTPCAGTPQDHASCPRPPSSIRDIWAWSDLLAWFWCEVKGWYCSREWESCPGWLLSGPGWGPVGGWRGVWNGRRLIVKG